MGNQTTMAVISYDRPTKKYIVDETINTNPDYKFRDYELVIYVESSAYGSMSLYDINSIYAFDKELAVVIFEEDVDLRTYSTAYGSVSYNNAIRTEDRPSLCLMLNDIKDSRVYKVTYADEAKDNTYFSYTTRILKALECYKDKVDFDYIEGYSSIDTSKFINAIVQVRKHYGKEVRHEMEVFGKDHQYNEYSLYFDTNGIDARHITIYGISPDAYENLYYSTKTQARFVIGEYMEINRVAAPLGFDADRDLITVADDIEFEILDEVSNEIVTYKWEGYMTNPFQDKKDEAELGRTYKIRTVADLIMAGYDGRVFSSFTDETGRFVVTKDYTIDRRDVMLFSKVFDISLESKLVNKWVKVDYDNEGNVLPVAVEPCINHWVSQFYIRYNEAEDRNIYTPYEGTLVQRIAKAQIDPTYIEYLRNIKADGEDYIEVIRDLKGALRKYPELFKKPKGKKDANGNYIPANNVDIMKNVDKALNKLEVDIVKQVNQVLAVDNGVYEDTTRDISQDVEASAMLYFMNRRHIAIGSTKHTMVLADLVSTIKDLNIMVRDASSDEELTLAANLLGETYSTFLGYKNLSFTKSSVKKTVTKEWTVENNKGEDMKYRHIREEQSSQYYVVSAFRFNKTNKK